MHSKTSSTIPIISVPIEPRMGCVLLIDTSSRMDRASMESLNCALIEFNRTVSNDETAHKRVDVAVVASNSTAHFVQDIAVDIVKKWHYFHSLHGNVVYRPWIFMIVNTFLADDEALDVAIQRIQEEERKEVHGKFKLFALGVGNYDKDILCDSIIAFVKGVISSDKLPDNVSIVRNHEEW